jgi:CO/xanthine dehydrogenase FAD-binding subunit
MCSKTILAVSGAALALVVASPVALAAPATQVTVRVEGKTRTLLASKSVHTHAGSITRGGALPGACPATSAAGALDVATGHRWSATWFTSLDDFEIKRILGDTESTKKFFWAIWVDNRFATTGACEIKLRRGEHLLFAVDSVAHHEQPLAIRVPSHAVAAKPFAVEVVRYSDSGASKPLAGAQVTAAGVSAVTDSHGIAHVVAPHAGTLAVGASGKGYIRAAQVRVHVTG